MATHNYNGTQKAAILLLSFGEDISSEIFKNLNEFEIKRIGAVMSRLGRLDETDIDTVILEFYDILQQNKQFFYGGDDFTKKVITSAFKGGEGEGMLEQLSISSAHLNSLELIDARTLAGFLRNEHPQTIALILAHLTPMKMSDTLKLIPSSLHTEVLLRLANIDTVSPELIEEIEEVLKQEVQTAGATNLNRVGGVDHIASMLNVVDKTTEDSLLDSLEERDPDLAERVRQLMFVFDDLVLLDDRGAQELIKSVNNDKWKLALRTATEGVKELIFRNMSERAAQMLKEDMEAMGAVKISEVEKCQQEVLAITKKLEEEGKLIINRGGGIGFV